MTSMVRRLSKACSGALQCALLCLLCGAFLAPNAEAAQRRKPRVALLHNNDNRVFTTFVPDVIGKLTSSQLFESVSELDAFESVPTLSQLNEYDAVLVCPVTSWTDRAAMGTNLAAYVDAGGGVVLSVFSFARISAGQDGLMLAGGWTSAYQCIPTSNMVFGSNATLGTVAAPTHPIMIGVETLDGFQRSWRPGTTSVSPGATLIASWSDDKPLVAVGPKPNRVDLGFYVRSSDGDFNGGYVSSTDGLKLMANALAFVSRPRILVIASDLPVSVQDVQTKISATGVFSRVDTFNSEFSTPTLEQLRKYDAVLVWCASSFANPFAIGNVLADYVDAGGGVVFGNRRPFFDPVRRPGGRWISDGYEIIPEDVDSTFGTATLGTVVYSGHPIMNGVATFNGGSVSARPTKTTVNPGGLIVAKWSDSKTLAAVSTKWKNRVDLGFYLPSNNASSGLWLPSTDGAKLMINSLLYTIKPYVACVAADAGNVNDVVNKLTATGRFSGVANIDVGGSTPSLAELSPFGSIITWQNGAFFDSLALGEVFVDYVDAGGGVVSAVRTDIAQTAPEGRWNTGGYDVVPPPLPPEITPQATLGAILEPDHPVAKFVRKFDGGGASYRNSPTPLLRGRAIFNWSDGNALASVHSTRRRVDLNFWPISGGWNSRTDGAWIMANALEWASVSSPCPGDFNGDGQVDDADFSLFVGPYNDLVDPRADLNGDGFTDDADFGIFVQGYNNLLCP
ncbi:MAG: hypothetical protein J0L78_13860 [Planctomycetes bacterium]|nr:hypothetical protein [Planctomycetota bacterium]